MEALAHYKSNHWRPLLSVWIFHPTPSILVHICSGCPFCLALHNWLPFLFIFGYGQFLIICRYRLADEGIWNNFLFKFTGISVLPGWIDLFDSQIGWRSVWFKDIRGGFIYFDCKINNRTTQQYICLNPGKVKRKVKFNFSNRRARIIGRPLISYWLFFISICLIKYIIKPHLIHYL